MTTANNTENKITFSEKKLVTQFENVKVLDYTLTNGEGTIYDMVELYQEKIVFDKKTNQKVVRTNRISFKKENFKTFIETINSL